MIILETPRLILREFDHADIAALHRLVSDTEVMKYSDGVESEPAARHRLDRFREMYRARGYGKWAVATKTDGALVGYCGFGEEVVDGTLSPEIGYRFATAVWGLGFATEAAQACATHAFQELRLSGFFGFAHPENRASCRVL